jgi:hypothetical protein
MRSMHQRSVWTITVQDRGPCTNWLPTWVGYNAAEGIAGMRDETQAMLLKDMTPEEYARCTDCGHEGSSEDQLRVVSDTERLHYSCEWHRKQSA